MVCAAYCNVHWICRDDFEPVPPFSFPCQYPVATGFSSARFGLLFVCQVNCTAKLEASFFFFYYRFPRNLLITLLLTQFHEYTCGLRFSNVQCEGLIKQLSDVGTFFIDERCAVPVDHSASPQITALNDRAGEIHRPVVMIHSVEM